jgi:hypothetical protein
MIGLPGIRSGGPEDWQQLVFVSEKQVKITD